MTDRYAHDVGNRLQSGTTRSLDYVYAAPTAAVNRPWKLFEVVATVIPISRQFGHGLIGGRLCTN